MLLGQGGESLVEIVQPAGGRICGERQRDKAPSRDAAHGGDVAESAGEALAAGFGGGSVLGEMGAFQEEVGGNEEILARLGGKHGTVIAEEAAAGQFADAGYEREFIHLEDVEYRETTGLALT